MSRSISTSISTPSASAAPRRSTSIASPTPGRSSSTTRVSKSRVSPTARASRCQWKVGAAIPKLGAPLAVTLRPDTKRLVISYKSGPDAGALQWLTPEQTAGKKQPYLFSQGESIQNRSWIPTQDSPGIRQTWEATDHASRRR